MRNIGDFKKFTGLDIIFLRLYDVTSCVVKVFVRFWGEELPPSPHL